VDRLPARQQLAAEDGPERLGVPARAEAVSEPELRDEIRRVMVAIFTELGPADSLAREHRRRLAAMLS
jgi:Tetratricopeptide repeat